MLSTESQVTETPLGFNRFNFFMVVNMVPSKARSPGQGALLPRSKREGLILYIPLYLGWEIREASVVRRP